MRPASGLASLYYIHYSEVHYSDIRNTRAEPPLLDQNTDNSPNQQANDNLADPFQGIDAIAAHLFKIKSVRHRTLLLHHEHSPPDFSIGFELTRAICSKIEQNFASILASAKFTRSDQNWRLRSPGTRCAEKNRPREVGLERALVAACHAHGRSDWWNQVPVASGLLGGRAGRKRAIDLVHRRGGNAYDFVELKNGSDTPVYAAIEILQYGFLWLFSRRARGQLGYKDPCLLDADDVVLSVLAPDAFYGNADYRAFGEGINSALSDLGAAHNVAFGFSFKRFSPEFVWTGAADPTQLCQILDTLYPD